MINVLNLENFIKFKVIGVTLENYNSKVKANLEVKVKIKANLEVKVKIKDNLEVKVKIKDNLETKDKIKGHLKMDRVMDKIKVCKIILKEGKILLI